MSRKTFVVLILMFLAPLSAAGQTSCLPNYTALNAIHDFASHESGAFVHNLIAENGNGLFVSRVQIVGTLTGGDISSLDLIARFDPSFDGVSLPYNLYSILVISNGKVQSYVDFTDACRSPGVSFFPGREFRIPSIKLIGADPQKLQIMVWGRL